MVNKYRIPILLSGIFALMISAYFTDVVIVLTGVFLTAILVSAIWGLSLVPVMLLSGLLYAALGSLLLHFLFLLGLSSDFTIVYLSIIAIQLIVMNIYKSKINFRFPGFSYVDVVHIVFIVASIAVLVGPTIGKSFSYTMTFARLGGTEDISSQAQMYNYVLQQESLSYLSTPGSPAVRDSLTSYPQGSHALLALPTLPFIDVNDSKQVFLSYWYGITFLYVLMTYLVLLLGSVLMTSLRLKKPKTVVFNLGLATFVFFTMTIGLMLPLYTHNFFGQIVAYVGLLGAVIVATFGAKDKRPKSFIPVLIVLMLCYYVVLSSWYVLAPLVVAIALPYLYTQRKKIRKHPRLIVMSGVVAVILTVALAYIYLFTTTGAGHILTPGGVEKISWLVLVVGAILSALAFFTNRANRHVILPSAIFSVGSIFLAATVFAYQMWKIGYPEYYYFKSLYTVALSIPIVLITSWYLFLKRGTSASNRQINLLIIVFGSISLIIFTLLQPSTSIIGYQELKYGVVEQTTPRLLDLAFEKHNNAKDVIFVGSCDEYLDFLATAWSGMTNLGYLDGRKTLESSLHSGDYARYENTLINYVVNNSETQIIVNVVGSCKPAVVDKLKSYENVIINEENKGVQP